MNLQHKRPRRTIATAHGTLVFGERTLLMAILNVTPDSFSDGGRFADPATAVERMMQVESHGADLVDLGGESTRPGSIPVSAADQIARVLPVIRAARSAGFRLPISIDTQSSEVADRALEAGADIVNDISAARFDPAMPALIARAKVPFIAMHMQGTPATMQVAPQYDDVVAEVGAFFAARAAALADAGVNTERQLIVDPGIGFGKTAAHNVELIRAAAATYGERWPVLLGPSRKGFIGRLLGESNPMAEGAAESPARLFGTAAVVACCALSGVDILRVHDVIEMKAVIRVTEQLASSES